VNRSALDRFMLRYAVTDLKTIDQRQYDKIDVSGYGAGEYMVINDRYVTMIDMRMPAASLDQIVDLCELFDPDKMNAATREAFDNFYLLYKMSKHYDSSIA
jgi:hypothetical protein